MPSLGVLGTLVYDSIYHPVSTHEAPLEQWGGIAYSLAGFSAARPDGWDLVPLIKVGEDLRSEAEEFLRSLPELVLAEGVRNVPEATNRVELRYRSSDDRQETLTGGVPGWTAEELRPLVGGLDALYINFISGLELDLRAARELRAVFDGPIYADLHSLFLGPAGAGPRMPRRLPHARDWLGCFDAVQLNADEASLLDCGPDHLPTGLALLVTTLGAEGAEYLGRPHCTQPPMLWRAFRTSTEPFHLSGAAEIPGGAVAGDPTGCGDVWGSAFFSCLLAEEPIDSALQTAHRLAAYNARSRDIVSLRSELAAEMKR